MATPSSELFRRTVRKVGLLLGAAAAFAVALLPAGPAVAAGSNAVLSTGAANPAGTNAAVGDTLAGGLLNGVNLTFSFTVGNVNVVITCGTLNLGATVSKNPAAPGNATGVINTLTFGTCTVVGQPNGTVTGVTLKPMTTAAVSVSDGTPPEMTVTGWSELFSMKTSLGMVPCVFGSTAALPNLVGVITNPGAAGNNGTVRFANQQVGLIQGGLACGAAKSFGTLNMTIGQITDNGASVYVN